MNCAEPTTLYDASPETALEAIRRHDGPILLDLDETLYLRNSTEDFIDSVRPAVLALLLLRLLDLIGPWRWTGADTRDSWRVLLISLLFPWAIPAWRRRSAELAQRYCNQPLLRAVQGRGLPPIVTTVGFRPIVRPLVAALGLSDAVIVCSRPLHFGDRRAGKLERTLRALGADTVQRGLVLTDSVSDLPLLAACARPLRTLWPEARYRPALSGVYVPGQYLSQVKHPGERYVWRGIVQEDFALWLLSSLGLALSPLLHVAGLAFLLASFWAIYERGYVDNDLIAARFEERPKLSAAFHAHLTVTPRWQPWLWAAACGFAGLTLLGDLQLPAPDRVLRWSAVLLATHGWFLLYNRYDKATRVWLYLGLQLARSASFLVLVPALPVGVAAIGAHLFARWMPYYLYRYGSPAWPNAPLQLVRLLLFLAMCTLLAATQGPSLLEDWSFAALLLWNLLRAQAQLRNVWQAAWRLDRGSAAPGSRA